MGTAYKPKSLQVDVMEEHVIKAMDTLYDTLKNKGADKVCVGLCGACETKLQSNCCKSREMETHYPLDSAGTRVKCLVCTKDCTPVYEVITPQFVSKSFSSSDNMAWFLSNYSLYHDFEIISQITTTSSGFLGLGGSTTYTFTLRNK